MKTLENSYNLYPVYETVEVMHIVVKSGILTIGKDKQSRVVIKGDSRVIELIDIIYNQNPDSTPTEGHISFFNDVEFVFPKGYTFKVTEADNHGIMVSFQVYKKELKGFNGQMVKESTELPWYPAYKVEEVDEAPKFVNL